MRGGGGLKNSEENMCQCHFMHHKSDMDLPGRTSDLRGEKPATNVLSYGTVCGIV
jgi:hypothetical protein